MMPTIYAHRLFHGEGCGHSVELSLDDYTYEKDTTVHPVTDEMMDAFVEDYIQTNTRDGDLISVFVNRGKLKGCLEACVQMRCQNRRGELPLTEQEKSYIIDAENFFEDYIGSRMVAGVAA